MAATLPTSAEFSLPQEADSDHGRSRPMVLHARVVTGAGGGPDKTILNSPRFLRPRGFECACLFLRPPADPLFESIRGRAQQAAAEIVELDDHGPWMRTLVARTAQICRQLNASIWHAHDYKTNLLGLLVKRKVPLRLVTTSHGWVERTWRTQVYHQVDRLTLRRYERVLAVSADIHAQCLRWGVSPDRLTLIHNAIDAAQMARRNEVAVAKHSLNWPTQRLLIGAVGRLSNEKGFDLLIDAVGQLASRGRDVGAVIAGGGPEESTLRRIIDDRQLNDRIRLLGFQSDLALLYEAMDVFTLSSRREGLPNVLLEAMAMGVPVVASSVAGVPTLVADGVNGILTRPGSVGDLVAAIARLADDSALRQRLADAGRDTIVDRYSFDARMDRVAALYNDLLSVPASQGKHR